MYYLRFMHVLSMYECSDEYEVFMDFFMDFFVTVVTHMIYKPQHVESVFLPTKW